MRRQSAKIWGNFLAVIFLISCRQTIKLNHDENQYQGVDWVTVYQGNQSVNVSKDTIIYQTAWGNTPDSLKPKFDLNFCKDNFRFPYYFPDKDQLNGKADQTISKTENEYLKIELWTTYTMTYNKDGRIIKYSIVGPATIHSSDFAYDDRNRIQEISDGWNKIKVIYNDFDNIETISSISPTGQKSKELMFLYTYVAFPRH